MTEEQIKQNAIKAAAEFKDWHHPQMSFYDGYIAGAHSLADEIKELKENLGSLQEQYDSLFEGFKKRGTKLGELMKENVKLRNPWISVEEHPTDVTKDYLLEYEDGSHIVAMWDSGMWMSKNLHPLKEPTRWMPIPELQKEE